MSQSKQVDTDFKVVYAKLGGHMHARLFTKPRSSTTWQKSGEFVLGEENWIAFVNSFDAQYEEQPGRWGVQSRN